MSDALPSRFLYDSFKNIPYEIKDAIVAAKDHDSSFDIIDNNVSFAQPEMPLTRKNGAAILRLIEYYSDATPYHTVIKVGEETIAVWVKTGRRDGTNAGWETFSTTKTSSDCVADSSMA